MDDSRTALLSAGVVHQASTENKKFVVWLLEWGLSWLSAPNSAAALAQLCPHLEGQIRENQETLMDNFEHLKHAAAS